MGQVATPANYQNNDEKYTTEHTSKINFVCLFGFIVAFKHLRSYQGGAFLKQWYFDQPHGNVMPQTQNMTPKPVTVYRHEADLSLCFTLVWNVTLEHKATQD